MSLALMFLGICTFAAGAVFINYLTRRFSRMHLRICPICAGVAGTWLTMLTLRSFGYAVDLLLLATLMGGSAVGIAYQYERLLADRYRMAWKMTFIPLGFAAVYGAVTSQTVALSISIVLLILAAFFFAQFRVSESTGRKKAEALQQKMKECC